MKEFRITVIYIGTKQDYLRNDILSMFLIILGFPKLFLVGLANLAN